MYNDIFEEHIDKRIINFLVPVILALGFIIRFLQLGNLPAGVNQDEAFAGYEAFSLLNYGIDSSGHHYPVYLNTWGSGMNALNTYLMMPFVKILGLNTWSIRLPQCIIGCLSLFIAFKIFQEIANDEIALYCMFFLTIAPWHIMLSRWGLESNLAPGFILLGLYFFILGLEESKFFMLSALMYGLSLYCYATIWPIVPIILILQLAYILYTDYVELDKFVWISVGILFLLALPLILFIMVNKNIIPEIETAFFSIPKLTYMRDSEVSFAHIPENFINMMKIIITQNDDLYWNSPEQFGIYYNGTQIFSLIGLGFTGYHTFLSIKEKKYNGLILVLPTFIGALILGCIINVNVNRMNIIHMPILFFAGIGLYFVVMLIARFFKYSWAIFITFYTVVCLCFSVFYFTTYQDNIAVMFDEGLDRAVERAAVISDNKKPVYVEWTFLYSKILFYSKMPVTTYIDTVEYTNYPSPYLEISKCGNFYYNFDSYDLDSIYLLSADSGRMLGAYGWTVEYFDSVCIAYFVEGDKQIIVN